jgi:hypothetical protein
MDYLQPFEIYLPTARYEFCSCNHREDWLSPGDDTLATDKRRGEVLVDWTHSRQDFQVPFCYIVFQAKSTSFLYDCASIR